MRQAKYEKDLEMARAKAASGTQKPRLTSQRQGKNTERKQKINQ